MEFWPSPPGAVCHVDAMADESNDLAIRCFLLGARRLGEEDLPEYGELAKLFGGIAQSQPDRLWRLYRQCDERAEPDITALVINKRTRRPGLFKGEQWVPGPRSDAQWRDTLIRIRAYAWSNAGLTKGAH